MIKAVLLVLSKIGLILFFQILAKCNGQFLQLWICSVRSSCITEVMCWSHPWHRAERVTVKFWSQCLQYLQRYLEIFSSHLAAAVQCPCWKLTIYHWFVDTLSKYDLFWWLVPEKIAICLQRSWTKCRYFIWAKRSSEHRLARCDCPLCAQHRAA